MYNKITTRADRQETKTGSAHCKFTLVYTILCMEIELVCWTQRWTVALFHMVFLQFAILIFRCNFGCVCEPGKMCIICISEFECCPCCADVRLGNSTGFIMTSSDVKWFCNWWFQAVRELFGESLDSQQLTGKCVHAQTPRLQFTHKTNRTARLCVQSLETEIMRGDT